MRTYLNANAPKSMVHLEVVRLYIFVLPQKLRRAVNDTMYISVLVSSAYLMVSSDSMIQGKNLPLIFSHTCSDMSNSWRYQASHVSSKGSVI